MTQTLPLSTLSILPDLAGAFVFENYNSNEQDGLLTLTYAYRGGPRFRETIRFRPPEQPLTPARRAAFDAACRLLFLFAGISYYKAGIPDRIECPAFPLDEKTAAFVAEVYLKGLGEFSYRNSLDLRGRLNFMQAQGDPSPATDLPGLCGFLVPVGGGKDSIVSIEALKKQHDPVTLFALSSSPHLPGPIQATIDAAGLPANIVTRQLSPKLFDLNQAGAYNGHIPITAILSMIAVCDAILHGRKYVVLSNEHSASVGNLRYNDLEINHQYSKSLAFERQLGAYIEAHISPDIVYLSLLRPLSEAAIAKRFASCPRYHGLFRSCNTAFRQDVDKRGTHWCRDCPKCRFVFLALSNFLPKSDLISIFGGNMLNDETQTEGFAELCGLSAHKPFECVGEIDESALLLEYLARQPDWQSDRIVSRLGPLLAARRQDFDRDYQTLFALHDGHNVPAHLMELLN